jgi:hypothetical protein
LAIMFRKLISLPTTILPCYFCLRKEIKIFSTILQT